jgi:hypothetical protein
MVQFPNRNPFTQSPSDIREGWMENLLAININKMNVILTDTLLDRWFDGLGFASLEKITGNMLYDYGMADAYCSSAKKLWCSLSMEQKAKWFEELRFEDHMNFNEVEFLTANA